MSPIVLASRSSGEDYGCELILSLIVAPKTKDNLQGRLYGSNNKELVPVKDNEGDSISILSNHACKKRKSSTTTKHPPRQHSGTGREGQEVSLSHRLQSAGLVQAESMAENCQKTKTNYQSRYSN